MFDNRFIRRHDRTRVRQGIWATFAITPVGATFAWCWVHGGELALWLLRDWWVLPLSVTAFSILGLAGCFLLAQSKTRHVSEGLSSLVYLMAVASLSFLGVSSSFGLVSPGWAVDLIPALLPITALTYYRSNEASEDGPAENA